MGIARRGIVSDSRARAAGCQEASAAWKIATTHERGRFPLILDDYVLREFLTTFVMVLCTFVLLMLVFTFFELLGDIIRNRTPLVTVGEYLFNLIPSMVYTLLPLGVLVAVLVTFGVLNRSSELTAMKATGISLYRVIVPVLVIAAILAVGLFLFDESYLPGANRRQEALRASSRASPRRPSCARTRSGSSASRSRESPAASSTTSSSIRTTIASPTSPSSNSIRTTSRSRGASLPPPRTGTRL